MGRPANGVANGPRTVEFSEREIIQGHWMWPGRIALSNADGVSWRAGSWKWSRSPSETVRPGPATRHFHAV